MSTDPREWVAAALETAGKATEGPWDAVRGVTPYVEKNSWVEVKNRVTICADVRPSDAEFIASARTGFSKALNALQAVLDLHNANGRRWTGFPRALIYCTACGEPTPCPTVQAIQGALDE